MHFKSFCQQKATYWQQTDPHVITTIHRRHIESPLVRDYFKTINKPLRKQRIPVITSAELCGAFGKRVRERRRLRDYEGRNIPPPSPLPSWVKMPHSLSLPDLFLSTLSLPVFALRAPALVHWHCSSPGAEKSPSKVHRDDSAHLLEKVKQTHICTKGICQSMTPWRQSIHHAHLEVKKVALRPDGFGVGLFFHLCFHGNHCFALFFPALHTSTQCDEK